ncbi:MAG: amino acid-binding ACT [Gemmataceae bacterium]
MSFKWDRVHLWAVETEDKPGSTAAKLSFLAQAGANLEYINTKRLPHKPGFGILYVAPVTGPSQVRAARSAGMHETDHPVVRRIEGDNEAGLAHRLTQQWELAGINLQGLTMAVMGNKFVGYASFDTVHDANRAAQILADLGVNNEPRATV